MLSDKKLLEKKIMQYLCREFENKKEQVLNIIVEDDKIREILKDYFFELEIQIKLKLTEISLLPNQ